jgi:hypothetical protein
MAVDKYFSFSVDSRLLQNCLFNLNTFWLNVNKAADYRLSA